MRSTRPKVKSEKPGRSPVWRLALRGSGAALLRLLPYALLIGAVCAAPAYVFRPAQTGGIYVGINTILAVGLNLLMGYAGQVSLGHAAFFGIGAYVSAVLTTQGMPQQTMGPSAVVIGVMAATAAVLALLKVDGGRLALCLGGFILAAAAALHLGPRHWLAYVLAVGCCLAVSVLSRVPPARLGLSYVFGGVVGFGTLALLGHILAAGAISPWYAMVAGVFFTCLVAYLIGIQALRLHGYYLAMATLGFGVIVTIVFREWEPVTGGTSGIYGIPGLQIAGKPLDNDVRMYYLVWALVVAVIALSANIVNSRVGRAFRAVHGSEVAAATLGVDTARYKVQVFVLSAALASIAGSLYAHYVTFISPEPFGFKFSIELVVMVVVGGMASIWGAIFGAGAITVLGELLRGGTLLRVFGIKDVSGWGLSPLDFDVVLFGLILVFIMVFLPAGLVRGAVDSVKLVVRLGRRKRLLGAGRER